MNNRTTKCDKNKNKNKKKSKENNAISKYSINDTACVSRAFETRTRSNVYVTFEPEREAHARTLNFR